MTPITRYIPNTLEKKLYTLSRAAKILKIKKDDIEFIYPCNDGCLVGTWNDAIFIKKIEFVKLLGLERKQRSNGLVVTPNAFRDNSYTVRNENKNTLYMVKTNQESIPCTCADYNNLTHDFNSSKVVCKHGYAVLNSLGYGCLKDWIKDNEQWQYEEREDIRHLAYN